MSYLLHKYRYVALVIIRADVEAYWFWVQKVKDQGNRVASLHIVGLLPNP